MSITGSKGITLHQCEAVIQEGLEAFAKVERALRVIEEMRLYPERYSSMDAYCMDNWELPQGLHSFFPANGDHVNRLLPRAIAK